MWSNSCVFRHNWALTGIHVWIRKNSCVGFFFFCCCTWICGLDFLLGFFCIYVTAYNSLLHMKNIWNTLHSFPSACIFCSASSKNVLFLHTCSLLCSLAVNKLWPQSLYLFYFFCFKTMQCVYSVICFSLVCSQQRVSWAPFLVASNIWWEQHVYQWWN